MMRTNKSRWQPTAASVRLLLDDVCASVPPVATARTLNSSQVSACMHGWHSIDLRSVFTVVMGCVAMAVEERKQSESNKSWNLTALRFFFQKCKPNV